MPLVNAVIAAAQITSSTYRILATAVMGYYLVKGVMDYERKRKAELKGEAIGKFHSSTSKGRRHGPRTQRGGPSKMAVELRGRRMDPDA